MKKWVIKNNVNKGSRDFDNNLIDNLLLSKGIDTKDKLSRFFYPKIEGMYNPYLLKDMDRAIEKIDAAIKKRKKIIIYGDYCVDGIASTSILYCALKKIGVDVGYYIPDIIMEGYCINKDAIDYIKCLQTDLIITVDCGIFSVKEVEYVKQLGMDIIITDHHECKDMIPDTIVINPKRKDCLYPFKNLSGCGVAFKLVQALWIKYGLFGVEDFLDIVAIGTIADVVDLVDENRIIVKHGLDIMRKSDKCGIRALKAVSNFEDEINSYNIASQIVPRINAAGRLSDAKIAVELFTTNDYDKALQIAKYLDQENKNRQRIEENILKEKFNSIVNKLSSENFIETLYIDMECDNKDINIETADMLRLFEPYGCGNPIPVFCMKGLSIISKKDIGEKNQHLKIYLGKGRYKYDALMFNGSKKYLNKDWNCVDVAFNISKNERNNKNKLQLIIKDMKPNKEWLNKNIKDKYHNTFKYILNNKIDNFNFNEIKFIKRDMDFLKDFIYFNRGYIMVSSMSSLDELIDFFDIIDVNLCENIGRNSQIIVNPNISNIKLYDNDILIYDFLPGEYEYKFLRKNTKGFIYNFFDGIIFDKIDKYFSEFIIEYETLISFYEDLMYNEFIGTIDDIVQRYNINPYKVYKIINYLKNNNKIEVMIKNEKLKIICNNKSDLCNINLAFQEKYLIKREKLKLKLQDLFKEE